MVVTGEHYNLTLSVRSFRVNRDDPRNHFVVRTENVKQCRCSCVKCCELFTDRLFCCQEYQVGVLMRIRADNYKWLMWKRFSDFEALDKCVLLS